MAKDGDYAQIKLPSGEVRRVRLELPRDSVWTIEVYLGNFESETFSVDGVAAGSHDLVWTLPR